MTEVRSDATKMSDDLDMKKGEMLLCLLASHLFVKNNFHQDKRTHPLLLHRLCEDVEIAMLEREVFNKCLFCLNSSYFFPNASIYKAS
jgi:hypothetical protein